MHLRRRTKEVHYFLQNQEVDFHCRIGNERIVANVCLDLHAPETRARELNGLAEALRYFDCAQGWLLTRSHEETVVHDGGTIFILPLWKWLVMNG